MAVALPSLKHGGGGIGKGAKPSERFQMYSKDGGSNFHRNAKQRGAPQEAPLDNALVNVGGMEYQWQFEASDGLWRPLDADACQAIHSGWQKNKQFLATPHGFIDLNSMTQRTPRGHSHALRLVPKGHAAVSEEDDYAGFAGEGLYYEPFKPKNTDGEASAGASKAGTPAQSGNAPENTTLATDGKVVSGDEAGASQSGSPTRRMFAFLSADRKALQQAYRSLPRGAGNQPKPKPKPKKQKPKPKASSPIANSSPAPTADPAPRPAPNTLAGRKRVKLTSAGDRRRTQTQLEKRGRSPAPSLVGPQHSMMQASHWTVYQRPSGATDIWGVHQQSPQEGDLLEWSALSEGPPWSIATSSRKQSRASRPSRGSTTSWGLEYGNADGHDDADDDCTTPPADLAVEAASASAGARPASPISGPGTPVSRPESSRRSVTPQSTPPRTPSPAPTPPQTPPTPSMLRDAAPVSLSPTEALLAAHDDATSRSPSSCSPATSPPGTPQPPPADDKDSPMKSPTSPVISVTQPEKRTAMIPRALIRDGRVIPATRLQSPQSPQFVSQRPHPTARPLRQEGVLTWERSPDLTGSMHGSDHCTDSSLQRTAPHSLENTRSGRSARLADTRSGKSNEPRSPVKSPPSRSGASRSGASPERENRTRHGHDASKGHRSPERESNRMRSPDSRTTQSPQYRVISPASARSATPKKRPSPQRTRSPGSPPALGQTLTPSSPQRLLTPTSARDRLGALGLLTPATPGRRESLSVTTMDDWSTGGTFWDSWGSGGSTITSEGTLGTVFGAPDALPPLMQGSIIGPIYRQEGKDLTASANFLARSLQAMRDSEYRKTCDSRAKRQSAVELFKKFHSDEAQRRRDIRRAETRARTALVRGLEFAVEQTERAAQRLLHAQERKRKAEEKERRLKLAYEELLRKQQQERVAANNWDGPGRWYIVFLELVYREAMYRDLIDGVQSRLLTPMGRTMAIGVDKIFREMERRLKEEKDKETSLMTVVMEERQTRIEYWQRMEMDFKDIHREREEDAQRIVKLYEEREKRKEESVKKQQERQRDDRNLVDRNEVYARIQVTKEETREFKVLADLRSEDLHRIEEKREQELLERKRLFLRLQAAARDEYEIDELRARDAIIREEDSMFEAIRELAFYSLEYINRPFDVDFGVAPEWVLHNPSAMPHPLCPCVSLTSRFNGTLASAYIHISSVSDDTPAYIELPEEGGGITIGSDDVIYSPNDKPIARVDADICEAETECVTNPGTLRVVFLPAHGKVDVANVVLVMRALMFTLDPHAVMPESKTAAVRFYIGVTFVHDAPCQEDMRVDLLVNLAEPLFGVAPSERLVAFHLTAERKPVQLVPNLEVGGAVHDEEDDPDHKLERVNSGLTANAGVGRHNRQQRQSRASIARSSASAARGRDYCGGMLAVKYVTAAMAEDSLTVLALSKSVPAAQFEGCEFAVVVKSIRRKSAVVLPPGKKTDALEGGLQPQRGSRGRAASTRRKSMAVGAMRQNTLPTPDADDYGVFITLRDGTWTPGRVKRLMQTLAYSNKAPMPSQKQRMVELTLVEGPSRDPTRPPSRTTVMLDVIVECVEGRTLWVLAPLSSVATPPLLPMTPMQQTMEQPAQQLEVGLGTGIRRRSNTGFAATPLNQFSLEPDASMGGPNALARRRSSFGGGFCAADQSGAGLAAAPFARRGSALGGTFGDFSPRHGGRRASGVHFEQDHGGAPSRRGSIMAGAFDENETGNVLVAQTAPTMRRASVKVAPTDLIAQAGSRRPPSMPFRTYRWSNLHLPPQHTEILAHQPTKLCPQSMLMARDMEAPIFGHVQVSSVGAHYGEVLLLEDNATLSTVVEGGQSFLSFKGSMLGKLTCRSGSQQQVASLMVEFNDKPPYACLAFVQEVLRCLAYKCEASPRPGQRAVNVEVLQTEAAEGENGEREEQTLRTSIEVRVLPPALVIQGGPSAFTYTEGQPARRVGLFDCPSGYEEQLNFFDGGHLLVEIVRGGDEHDVLCLEEPVRGDFYLEDGLVRQRPKVLNEQPYVIGRVASTGCGEPMRIEFGRGETWDASYVTATRELEIFSLECGRGVEPKVRSKLLKSLLCCIAYKNTSDNPKSLQKFIRLTVVDWSGAQSEATVEVNINAVNNPTDIILAHQRITYRQATPSAEGGLPMFPDARLEDVDTQHVCPGGFMEVELISGDTSYDVIQFGTLNGADEPDPDCEDESLVTTTEKDVYLGATRCGTWYQREKTMHKGLTVGMTFTAMVSLDDCSTLLQAFAYSNTLVPAKTGVRVFAVRFNAGDEVQDSRAKLEIDVVAPVIYAPSFTRTIEYTEGAEPLMVNQKVTSGLPHTTPLTGCKIVAEIVEGYHPDQDVLNFSNKAVFLEEKGTGVLTGRQLGSRGQVLAVVDREHADANRVVMVTFPTDAHVTIKHLNAFFRGILYHNTSKDPTSDVRKIRMRLTLGTAGGEAARGNLSTWPESGLSEGTVEVALGVNAVDDRTVVEPVRSLVCHVMHHDETLLFEDCVVEDVDTHYFPSGRSYLEVQLTGVEKLTLNDHTLGLRENDSIYTMRLRDTPYIFVDGVKVGKPSLSVHARSIVYRVDLIDCPLASLRTLVRAVGYRYLKPTAHVMQGKPVGKYTAQVVVRGSDTVVPTRARVQVVVLGKMLELGQNFEQMQRSTFMRTWAKPGVLHPLTSGATLPWNGKTSSVVFRVVLRPARDGAGMHGKVVQKRRLLRKKADPAQKKPKSQEDKRRRKSVQPGALERSSRPENSPPGSSSGTREGKKKPGELDALRKDSESPAETADFTDPLEDVDRIVFEPGYPYKVKGEKLLTGKEMVGSVRQFHCPDTSTHGLTVVLCKNDRLAYAAFRPVLNGFKFLSDAPEGAERNLLVRLSVTLSYELDGERAHYLLEDHYCITISERGLSPKMQAEDPFAR